MLCPICESEYTAAGDCPKRSAVDCPREVALQLLGTVHGAALGTVPKSPEGFSLLGEGGIYVMARA